MPGTFRVTRVTIEYESEGQPYQLRFAAPKLPNSIVFNRDEAGRVHSGAVPVETGAGASARTLSSQAGPVNQNTVGSATYMVIHDPDCEWWSLIDGTTAVA